MILRWIDSGWLVCTSTQTQSGLQYVHVLYEYIHIFAGAGLLGTIYAGVLCIEVCNLTGYIVQYIVCYNVNLKNIVKYFEVLLLTSPIVLLY